MELKHGEMVYVIQIMMVLQSFDVDSDNDGCADAIEGSENVKYNQIHALDLPASRPNYAYRGQIKVKYDGTTTGTPSGNHK